MTKTGLDLYRNRKMQSNIFRNVRNCLSSRRISFLYHLLSTFPVHTFHIHIHSLWAGFPFVAGKVWI